MKPLLSQFNLFQLPTPAKVKPFEKREAQKALDQLFTLTTQYKTSTAYKELLAFVGRFRFYSPYNAMLIHVQMPGAQYVASPSRWSTDYGRSIRPGARPIVILQPRGPVMFVFDLSDTEAGEDAPELPRQVTHPFEVRKGSIGQELQSTIENAKRDGIRFSSQNAGAQSAGAIRQTKHSAAQGVITRLLPTKQVAAVKVRYEVLVNTTLSREAQYVTLVHELAHLYCGHLGSPDPTWWPDRRSVPLACREFEAESVAYLVCARFGIDNPSETYLHTYLDTNGQVPPISLEAVMTASGLIEAMSRKRLPLRKPGAKAAQSPDSNS
jgi:hypothetical protein